MRDQAVLQKPLTGWRLYLSERLVLQGIVKNSSWLLLDKAVRFLVVFLVGAWVARYLGPRQYGELAYTIAYIAFFQAIAGLGLDGIVVRDVARDKSKAPEILGTTFVLRLCAGLLCWLSAICLSAVLHREENNNILITALVGASLIFQAADTIDLWFQSQTQNKYAVFAKVAAYLISNGLRIALILSGAPFIAFAALCSIEVLIIAFSLAWAYRRFPCVSNWKLLGSQARHLTKNSWPFMIAGIVNISQARIEYVLIESILGKVAVAQYAIALSLIEMFDIAGIVLGISIYPYLAKKTDNGVSDDSMRKIYRAFILLYICITPILLIFLNIITFVYGEQYTEAKNIFTILALRPLLAYIGIARNMSLRIDDRIYYPMFCSFVGLLVAWITAVAYIPKLGLIGAAISAIASYLVSNFLLDAIFYRRNMMNILRCMN